jgi:hypothetical protein
MPIPFDLREPSVNGAPHQDATPQTIQPDRWDSLEGRIGPARDGTPDSGAQTDQNVSPADPSVKAQPIPDQVKIELGTDEFRVNAEAEATLGSASGLYSRGGYLVQVIEHKSQGRQRIRRPESAPVIRNLPQPLLREMLTRLVECVRPVKNKKGKSKTKVASLPGHVVQTIHCRGVWQNVPHLAGVVGHPVLFSDGSILATPGYDRESGLMVWLPEGLKVSVPAVPTRADVLRARDVLLDVVIDFPFKTAAHKSAWLAGLLTPLGWYAFSGSAPLTLYDANVAGAGKGLLADVSFLVVTGRQASVMGYSHNKDEMEKCITTLAMDGDEMVLLDNLGAEFGNEAIDRALTSQRQWKNRMLGVNRQYDGPINVVWYATGNNVSLLGDTPRRVLQVLLKSLMEHPEERTGFKYPNLREYVLENRGPLLSAGLTLLRAYIMAGKPNQNLTPWGSFDEWSELIRGAIVWCGMPDPGDTREELRRTAVRETGEISDLLTGIAYLDPRGNGLTVSQIVDSAKAGLVREPVLKALYNAICVLCPGENGQEVARLGSVGMKFHHLESRVFDGKCLERMDTDRREAARWRVIASAQAEKGD